MPDGRDVWQLFDRIELFLQQQVRCFLPLLQCYFRKYLRCFHVVAQDFATDSLKWTVEVQNTDSLFCSQSLRCVEVGPSMYRAYRCKQ
ncbi:hypothetical protein ASF04_06510 [Duganella sp. Leaf61]|nr:hypothetical protein ASF04_06510 [Duganella sp. Leaf61]